MIVAVSAILLSLSITSANCTAPPLAESQTPAASSPSYKPSSGGLKDQIKEILEAHKKNQADVLSEKVKVLVLPVGTTWFSDVFGDQLGGRLKDDYERRRAAFARTLEANLVSSFNSKMTDIEVIELKNDCEEQARDEQYPVLLARKKKEALYEVRLGRGNVYQSYSLFAYVDGAFRFIDMPLVNSFSPPRSNPSESPASETPRRIRVGGSVQQAMLLHTEPPVYPEKAKSRGLQGTVRLAAIIAKDGSVQNVQVVKGHCFLADSAVYAVKKWRYRPTLLEGKPVEVVTTVDVVFTLSMRR